MSLSIRINWNYALWPTANGPRLELVESPEQLEQTKSGGAKSRIAGKGVSTLHKRHIPRCLCGGRRAIIFTPGRIAAGGIDNRSAIEPTAAGRVAIRPAKGAAVQVEDRWRILKGCSCKIVCQRTI